MQAMFGFIDREKEVAHKMSNAMCGAVIGVLVFGGGLGLLGWNEKRAVYRARTIDSARTTFTQLESCAPSAVYDGKLVAIKGCLPRPVDDYVVTDQDLAQGIGSVLSPLTTPASYLSWDRSVENFSYREAEHTDDDGKGHKSKSYTYTTGWVSSRQSFVNPNPYPHRDPSIAWPDGYSKISGNLAPLMCIGDRNVTSCSPRERGTFHFAATDNFQKGKMQYFGDSEQVPILSTARVTTAIGSQPTAGNCNNYLQTTSTNPSSTCYNPRASDGDIIGDFRWSFERRVVRPSTVLSGLALQVRAADGSAGFQPWQNPDYPDSSYGKIGDFYNKDWTGDEILDQLESDNTVLTWVLRFVGWLLVWLSCQMCVAPIAIIPEFLPVIGEFVGGIVNSVLCCMTCVAGTSVSVLVIGIAWVAFRPVIGIPLLIVFVLGTAGVTYILYKNQQRRKRIAAEENQPLQGGQTHGYGDNTQQQQPYYPAQQQQPQPQYPPQQQQPYYPPPPAAGQGQYPPQPSAPPAGAV